MISASELFEKKLFVTSYASNKKKEFIFVDDVVSWFLERYRKIVEESYRDYMPDEAERVIGDKLIEMVKEFIVECKACEKVKKNG